MKTPKKLIVLGAAALLPLQAFAQGTIVYVNPPDVIVGLYEAPQPFDLDGNGVMDVVFDKSGAQFDVVPTANNQVTGSTTRRAEPVPFGQPITSNSAWEGRIDDPVLGDRGLLLALAYTFPATGPFAGVDGYLGIRFYRGTDLHYGWIRLDLDNGYPNQALGYLTEWAYNSTPKAPLAAGVVPEPSTLALFALGAAALWKFRRSRA